MRLITETKTIYKFNSAPNDIKEKIKEYLTNDGTLYEHNFNDRIATLKKVAELLDGKLDYFISVVPIRGEFIKVIPNGDNDTLNYVALWDAVDVDEECPLTGDCYDHDFIDHLSKYNMCDERLNFALSEFLKSIHDEWENMCGDEYLADHCEANDYEFYSNGKIY